MFSDNRDEIRQMYFSIWEKYQQKQPLEPLEQQVLAVILEHPEYHDLLNNREKYIDKDYLPEFGETNPFLHMGLHLGIREQVQTNRPAGISEIYQTLLQDFGGDHMALEHEMMECLVEQIWQQQKNNQPPNEADYLRQLRAIRNKR
jgi:hypothetical protein